MWSKSIYLCINNCLNAFKVIPFRYNTRALLFRFFFYFDNRSKTLSLHHWLRLWKEKEVSGRQVRWIWWLVHGNSFFFFFFAENSLTRMDAVCFWWILFVMDHTTLLQEFMMPHAIAIEENTEQILYIWPWRPFFQSLFFWMFPLGWLNFGLTLMILTPFLKKSGSSLLTFNNSFP